MGPKGKAQGAYDLRAGVDEADPAFFAESILQCLLRKGFCVIAGDEGQAGLDKVLEGVHALEGHFEVPPAEIAEGLLGTEGSLRMAPLEARSWPIAGSAAAAVSADAPSLQTVDDRLYSWGASIALLSPMYLGFELTSRDHGLVLAAGPTAPEAPPELSAAACYKWLSTFEMHRIMGLFFMGPSGGTLEMKPFDEVSGTHQVQVEPGTYVLLRADALSHRFAPKGTGYALGCFYFQAQTDTEPRRKQADFPLVPVAARLEKFLLQAIRNMKEVTNTQADLEAMASRPVQRMMNQMFQKGSQTAVRGQACRFPGNAGNVDFYRALLFTGTDAAEQIPNMRWDNDMYYINTSSENLTAMANAISGWSHLRDRYNCEHGSFIEGLELFDNKFFGLSVMESRGMDPNQRHLLETCYEVAFSAGMKKSSLMKAHIGVYTGGPGTQETEWSVVPKETEGGALASTSGSAAILSNRISYAFGMNGPNFLMNADAASALIAMGLASDALQRTKPQCDAALVLAIDAILHPLGYSQFCWAGQMSLRGRCLAFDQTADGYVRGEGSGGVYMNSFLHEVDGEVVVDEEPRALGLCSAAWSAHSGKVASLSAPSGAMDQELISNTLRVAEISPLDVDMVDAHAIGALLSDAVEGQALCRAYRGRAPGAHDEEQELLMVGSSTSTFGNGKPLAGMYAVVKVLLALELGQMAPSNHLRRINPHMMLEDYPVHFATEHVPQRMNSAFTGITAKGFGGACAHVILWGGVNFDRVALPKPILEQQEIVYWPGGGGELQEEAKPARSYMIVGTWASWSQPEAMKAEGRGAYVYTVIMGELGFERFQIWLDGDSERMLHPGMPGSMKDAPVKGPAPASEAEGFYWEITAGPSVQQAIGDGSDPLALPGRDYGRPGDRYEVRLLINGRYRMVTWDRVTDVEEQGGLVPTKAPACMGKYYLVASWADWTPQELAEDEATPGVHRVETRLLRKGGIFAIIRNQDWRQRLYPAIAYAETSPVIPVLGPDEQGRGLEWQLAGRLGDVFSVELRILGGEASQAALRVLWQKVGHEELSLEQLSKAGQPQFYLVGSWDRWTSRRKMEHKEGFYVHEVSLRGRDPENFQILVDGDWNRALYPGLANAGLRDTTTLRGPDAYGARLAWMIGKDPEEQGGGRFEIRLCVRDGVAVAVSWVRR